MTRYDTHAAIEFTMNELKHLRNLIEEVNKDESVKCEDCQELLTEVCAKIIKLELKYR